MPMPKSDGCQSALIPNKTYTAMTRLNRKMREEVAQHGDPTPEVSGDWLRQYEEAMTGAKPCVREPGHDRPHRAADGEEWWEYDEKEDQNGKG